MIHKVSHTRSQPKQGLSTQDTHGFGLRLSSCQSLANSCSFRAALSAGSSFHRSGASSGRRYPSLTCVENHTTPSRKLSDFARTPDAQCRDPRESGGCLRSTILPPIADKEGAPMSICACGKQMDIYVCIHIPVGSSTRR
jgi:hypothetical protein